MLATGRPLLGRERQLNPSELTTLLQTHSSLRRGTGSSLTLRWRKWDSNSRSPQKAERSVGTTTGRLLVPAHFAVYRRIGKGDQ